MSRNAVIDYARFGAAVGIVLFHSGAPGAAIGLAGLQFFLMLLVVLMVPAANAMPFGDFARARALRLLVPWAGWSALYGALKLADAVASGGAIADEFPTYVWLTGTEVHLWFLPFAFLSSLILYPIVRLRPDLPAFLWLTAGMILPALLLLGLHQSQSLPIPLAQWVYAGPATLLGLAFGLAANRIPWLLLAAGALGATMAAALAVGWHQGVLQLAIAGGALTICLLWYRPATPCSGWAAQLSLGIYLVHPLIGALLMRLTALQRGTLGFAFCMALGSVAVVWLGEIVTLRRARSSSKQMKE